MITYGFSLQGKSHIKKGVVCQDSHAIVQLENGWYVLAAADGVGSAKYSSDGSQIATQTIAEYCRKYVRSDMDGEQLVGLLQKAYQVVFQRIELFCQEQNGRIEDYDTTLSVGIYTGVDLFYGHAGDGGIIIKDIYGQYEMVTVPQKGEDGISVRPLRAGSDSWEFGIVQGKVAAVLLATDGMLDALLPPLLNMRRLDIDTMIQNKQMNVYVTLAEFFLNADCIFKNKNVKHPKSYLQNFLNGDITNEQFNECLYNAYSHMYSVQLAAAICNTVQRYNYCTWKINKVDDDKTIVCVINENIKKIAGFPQYYVEPDWKILQQRFDRLAYPSLYEQEEESIIENHGYEQVELQIDLTEPQEESGVYKNKKSIVLCVVLLVIAVGFAVLMFRMLKHDLTIQRGVTEENLKERETNIILERMGECVEKELDTFNNQLAIKKKMAVSNATCDKTDGF